MEELNLFICWKHALMHSHKTGLIYLILVDWLDLDKTLREQGIDESHSLLLKRKFFYSDQNVDIKDPVQLNLLYMQVINQLSS